MTNQAGRLAREKITRATMLRLGVRVTELPERPRGDCMIAAHEAAHGVLAEHYGLTVHHVAIDGHRGSGIMAPRRIDAPLPFVDAPHSERERRGANEDIIITLAGAAVEHLLFGFATSGIEFDIADAWRSAKIYAEAERVNAIVAQWNATLHLVSARRIAIENVAGHLLRRTYLTGGELRRILSGADAPDDLYRRMCAVHPGTHPDYWPIHWQ